METRILDIVVGMFRRPGFCFLLVFPFASVASFQTWQFVGFRMDNICGLWFASLFGSYNARGNILWFYRLLIYYVYICIYIIMT